MITIFFIVDGTRLEAQVALLASTLVHHNADRFNYIGYVSQAHQPALNPSFTDLMDRCGVALRPLPAAVDAWAHPFPHGNKIRAATDRRSGTQSLWLDSDIICTAPLNLDRLIADRSIGVVAEGKPTWGKDLADWKTVHAHFGLPLPEDRVTLRRGKRRQVLPYFNAGVILFPEGPLVGDKSFGDLWLETALAIDHHVKVPKKRPWLDQISLPVTVKRFGLDYILAEDALNYSISHRAQIGDEVTTLIHYHSFSDLAAWDNRRQIALNQTAALAGDVLFRMLSSLYAEWWHLTPQPRDPVKPD
jgi:hypothetical protein